jgi:hypothetical protein
MIAEIRKASHKSLFFMIQQFPCLISNEPNQRYQLFRVSAGSGILTAFDNCGTAVVTASVDPYTEDKCNGYAITYRWRATDECGNYTDLTQTFNVLPDKEKPVFNSEPSPISDISCEQGLPVQELLQQPIIVVRQL